MNVPKLVFVDLRGGSPRPLAAPLGDAVLCLGSFDGVHIAHLALLREGLRLRDERLPGGFCGAFCFLRPPMDYLPDASGAPRAPHTHLTTLREKLRLFARAGIDFACLCDFPSVVRLSPAAFADLLKGTCRCRGAVCGFNYRFGNRAEGDARLLSAFFSSGGLFSFILPDTQLDGRTVSASAIRRLLAEGDPAAARALLGRPYALESTVMQGVRLGRAIGFPTANQYFPLERLIPKTGAYAVVGRTPFGSYTGVANVGRRPTVAGPGAPVNCETFLLDLRRDLYGRRIRVEFLRYLRPERKFDSVAELSAAIRHDAREALRLTAGDPLLSDPAEAARGEGPP